VTAVFEGGLVLRVPKARVYRMLRRWCQEHYGHVSEDVCWRQLGTEGTRPYVVKTPAMQEVHYHDGFYSWTLSEAMIVDRILWRWL
jgi:hypothetical protein